MLTNVQIRALKPQARPYKVPDTDGLFLLVQPDRNPADILRGALTVPKVRHHAAIVEPAKVGDLLRAIEEYKGRPETIFALRLAPHVFLRPGELRQAKWSEIDFADKVWRVPAERMKMKQPHAVPLSRQTVYLLQELRSLARPSEFLFPALHTTRRSICENTLNTALRRLGFEHDEMTSHGFRAMASTLLNESGLWHPDAIERALAHGERDRVRAAYHRGAHWAEPAQLGRPARRITAAGIAVAQAIDVAGAGPSTRAALA